MVFLISFLFVSNFLSISPFLFHSILSIIRSIRCGFGLTYIPTYIYAHTYTNIQPVGFVTMSDSGTLCSNLIRDVLSVYISEMLDDGTIKGILDDYSKSTKTNTCSDSGATSDSGGGSSSNSNSNSNDDKNSSGGGIGSGTQSLSLWDLGGLFIIVYLVWILASIIALMSWYVRKRKRNQKRNSQQDNNNDDVGRTAAEGDDDDGNIATDTNSIYSNHNNDNTIDPHRQQQQQLRHQDGSATTTTKNFNPLNNSRIQKEDTKLLSVNNHQNINTNTNTHFTPSERDQLAFQLDSMRQQMEEMQTLLLLPKK